MSRSGPQTAVVDVFLMLLRDEGREALFGLRGPAVFAAYRWNLPSGKAEPDEDALSAVIRETYEETGVHLAPGDLRPVGVVYARGRDGQSRAGFPFAADHDPQRHAEAVNTEPHKCSALQWFPLKAPPALLEAYNASVIALYMAGNMFAYHGWS